MTTHRLNLTWGPRLRTEQAPAPTGPRGDALLPRAWNRMEPRTPSLRALGAVGAARAEEPLPH
eukprot:15470714-Alexandrium_andersonii.AAC.1